MKPLYLALVFVFQFFLGFPSCQVLGKDKDNTGVKQDQKRDTVKQPSVVAVPDSLLNCQRLKVVHDSLIIVIVAKDSLLQSKSDVNDSERNRSKQSLKDKNKELETKKEELEEANERLTEDLDQYNIASRNLENYVKKKKELMSENILVLGCSMYKVEKANALLNNMELELQELRIITNTEDLKTYQDSFAAISEKIIEYRRIYKLLEKGRTVLESDCGSSSIPDMLSELKTLKTKISDCQGQALDAEVEDLILLFTHFCTFNNETFHFLNNMEGYTQELVREYIEGYKDRWIKILELNNRIDLDESYPKLLKVMNDKYNDHEMKLPLDFKICNCTNTEKK